MAQIEVQTHLADVWWRGTDVDVVAGEGATVVGADGTRYLDFTCGVGVTNTGHCHPRVVEAIREQAGRFIHAQVNVYRHPLLEPLGARLAEVTPGGIDRFFLTNSGAEAMEGAVKLARYATKRPNVIVFEGGFHGRTSQTMAMSTSKVVYRAGYQPLPSGTFVAPFPYAFRTGEEPDACAERCLEALRTMLKTQTAPGETAAVVLETVLGEGGYVVPPARFLHGLAELCREHGFILVLDEIQCGFGRTGTFFACERFGIEPDILVMAKGLGSGFPIAAIGASAEIMAKWLPGTHGGTYGGNPIGCAAALATIDVILEEGLLGNALERGAQLVRGLRALQAGHPAIGDVRGLGLMIGVELVAAGRRPDPALAKAVIAHCRDEGNLLVLDCGTDGNVIRLIPPLTITADEIARALEAVGAALDATA